MTLPLTWTIISFSCSILNLNSNNSKNTHLKFHNYLIMDPPPTTFSGRRRSSVISLEGSAAPPPTLPTAASLVAPRKASTWDASSAASFSGGPATASSISTRRASAATAGSIAGRKASAWDDPLSIATTNATASDIAGRRATAVDRPPWDSFAGAPPGNVGSPWPWMLEIAAMTSSTPDIPPIQGHQQNFYGGNIKYIFDTHNNGQNVAIEDLEAIMQSYGVEEVSIQGILNRVDPENHGVFNTNSYNHQILLNTDMIKFSHPRDDPLNDLRHASKCFRKNLLSPLHFAAYIFDILKERCPGHEPRFMILGMYSILGVLEGSNKRKLTTNDVDTFMGLWKVLNPNEAQELKHMIQDDFNGSISCIDFYNMLYRRDYRGKQRIQMFDTVGLQPDPSLFFPLIDKDEDGFLSPDDLQSFTAIFGRKLSYEEIESMTCKLDVDGDGKINCEDFSQAMVHVLDGMSWEFWLVAILIVLEVY